MSSYPDGTYGEAQPPEPVSPSAEQVQAALNLAAEWRTCRSRTLKETALVILAIEHARLSAALAEKDEANSLNKSLFEQRNKELNETLMEAVKLEDERNTLKKQLASQQEALSAAADAMNKLHFAYVPDGHSAPHDCFATGPLTGNAITDYILCPGCSAEKAYTAALARVCALLP